MVHMPEKPLHVPAIFMSRMILVLESVGTSRVGRIDWNGTYARKTIARTCNIYVENDTRIAQRPSMGWYMLLDKIRFRVWLLLWRILSPAFTIADSVGIWMIRVRKPSDRRSRKYYQICGVAMIILSLFLLQCFYFHFYFLMFYRTNLFLNSSHNITLKSSLLFTSTHFSNITNRFWQILFMRHIKSCRFALNKHVQKKCMRHWSRVRS